MAADLVDIDGAMGEGGGQVLRSSLTLAMLTGRPVRLRNIRAGRPKPGLQPQHRMSVRAAAEISQARVQGAEIGSQKLLFEPGRVEPGKYHFAIGTAGATGLVLQTIALPLALGADRPSEVVITGGTHVKAAPCYHFLEATWCYYLERLGQRVRLRMRRPGFYPRGGGVIEAQIQPARPIHHLLWPEAAPDPDDIRITGFSAVAGLPVSIAERQAGRANTRITRQGLRCEIEVQTWEGGPGTVLALATRPAKTPPAGQSSVLFPPPAMFFALGERGKPAERVADEAVDALVDHLDGGPCLVDPHSADQIVLPLALAQGGSSFPVSRVTQHLLTNLAVIRCFIDREIACTGGVDEPGRVQIR